MKKVQVQVQVQMPSFSFGTVKKNSHAHYSNLLSFPLFPLFPLSINTRTFVH